MDLKQALSYMVDNDYLLIVEGNVVVTTKLRNALGFTREVVAIDTTPTATGINRVVEVTKPTVKTSKRVTDEELRAMWHKFVEDAEVPYRVTTNDGSKYTVRQYGPTPAAHLLTVINSEHVDYKILTEATKNYYRTTTYKAILANYIIKDIWKDAYNDYLLNNGKATDDGSNRFED